jgi:hypothetical protein
MAQLNNVDVVPRFNRPTVENKAMLELFYINNGSYTDPYQISAVYVFSDTTASSAELTYVTNGNPELLIDGSATSTRYGLVASAYENQALFVFKNDAPETTDSSFNVTGFDGSISSLSGIYKVGTGHYACVLGPDASSTDSNGGVIANGASAAGNYFDIWTVKNSNGASYTTYINRFSLYQDKIYVSTEPLGITATTKLVNSYIELDSKVNLTFQNMFTINNRNQDFSFKNNFRESIISDAALKITKLNDEPHLSSRYVVQEFSSTSSVLTTDSADTVLYNWDTAALKTTASSDVNFGPPTGVYEVQLKMTVLNETIYSPRFKVIVR